MSDNTETNTENTENTEADGDAGGADGTQAPGWGAMGGGDGASGKDKDGAPSDDGATDTDGGAETDGEANADASGADNADNYPDGFGGIDDKTGWKKGLLDEDGQPSWEKTIKVIENQRRIIGKHGEDKGVPKAYSFEEDSPLGDNYAGRRVSDIEGGEFKELEDWAKENKVTNREFNIIANFAYESGAMDSDEAILAAEATKLKEIWGKDFDNKSAVVQRFFGNIYKNDPERLKAAQIMSATAEGSVFLYDITQVVKQSSGLPTLEPGQPEAHADILSQKQLSELRATQHQLDPSSEEYKELEAKKRAHYTAVEKRDKRKA